MSSLPSLAIKVEDVPDAETQQLIDDGLDEYNFRRAGPYNSEDLWVIARDANGMVRGGLKGKISYSWLFIDWLWVSASSRGAGIGSLLMDKVEAVACERGCRGAYLETFSFQAPAFYRSRGFEEFGRIDGYPPGHACIWLRKHFSDI